MPDAALGDGPVPHLLSRAEQSHQLPHGVAGAEHVLDERHRPLELTPLDQAQVEHDRPRLAGQIEVHLVGHLVDLGRKDAYLLETPGAVELARSPLRDSPPIPAQVLGEAGLVHVEEVEADGPLADVVTHRRQPLGDPRAAQRFIGLLEDPQDRDALLFGLLSHRADVTSKSAANRGPNGRFAAHMTNHIDARSGRACAVRLHAAGEIGHDARVPAEQPLPDTYRQYCRTVTAFHKSVRLFSL